MMWICGHRESCLACPGCVGRLDMAHYFGFAQADALVPSLPYHLLSDFARDSRACAYPICLLFIITTLLLYKLRHC